MPDIFLSYNHADQAKARLFAEAFQVQGFDVWWDTTLRTGEAYDQVTEKALKTAKAVVVLWTQKSVVSRWVRAEATLADRNKTLVPCMIEPCERPIMFELTQTAELSHWQGAVHDTAWLSFLADVNRYVRTERAPTAPGPITTLVPPPAAKPSEVGDMTSLAVMPFSNRSGLPADDALAYGMVEDIISAISLSPSIRVLASSTTVSWRDKAADLRLVGRDLGVRYVLEGNVRRSGVNLRVTVQLVTAETGAILWTQKFDRPLSELADLQEELVTEVAGYLGVALQNLEIERALAKPGDITAYEAVQRSLSVGGQLRFDRLPMAIAEARRAVAIAPDYSGGHRVLGLYLAVQFQWTGADDEAQAREAHHHVERALALGSNDPLNLSSVALALVFLGRPREALQHAQRSLQLNPNSSLGYRSLGAVLASLGRNDEAIAAFDSEERLAPRNFAIYASIYRRAAVHFQAERFEQATEEMERAFIINPDFPQLLVLRAGLCSLANRPDDARDAVLRLRRLEPNTHADVFAKRHLAMADAKANEGLIAAFRKVWNETPVLTEAN